ncbi:hypothetical protein [Lysobacter gummosus]
MSRRAADDTKETPTEAGVPPHSLAAAQAACARPDRSGRARPIIRT